MSTPEDPLESLANEIVQAAIDHGLLCFPGGLSSREGVLNYDGNGAGR
jgi:hypothetical protein